MTQFFYFCGHEQFQPETLVRHAQLAERAGFDGLLVSEHFHPWVDDKSASGFAWSTLGAMAQATDGLQLMTGVTTPLWRYHPALVAQAAATVDRLSNGRFYLGVGTGENINEGPLGYHFPKYRQRAARMREALEIMRRMLAGEKLSFTGKYYNTDRAKLYSPPLGQVPIYLAAGGPKSAALAHEMADGVVVSVKVPQDTIERVLIPIGRADEAGQVKAKSELVPDAMTRICAGRWSVFAENEEQAWEVLMPWRGLRAPGRLEAVDPADLRQRADNLPRREILDRYSIAKSVADLVQVYGPLVQEIQADIVAIQITSANQAATIELLGKEVLPHLRMLASGL